MVPITNNSSQGVVTKSGIVGAYVRSTTDEALRQAGQNWKATGSTHPIDSGYGWLSSLGRALASALYSP